MRAAVLYVWLAAAVVPGSPARAQPFHLPTANRDIYQQGGEERYFVGTVGKPWSSGTFGCTRSEGLQLHEGWDVRARRRDAQGEPADAVLATADGVVAYLNRDPVLSNYGRFAVLRHRVDGVEIYSTYAHLSRFREGLAVGQAVRAGEAIATMGRSANTRQGISRDRAHVHFELSLRISDRFTAWHKANSPGQRNDHGEFNGRNFAGVDPMLVFSAQRRLGTNFNLGRVLAGQTPLCRVLVRDADFAWLRRYPQFVAPSPRAGREGVAGHEITLNYHGFPIRLVPRAASEIKGAAKHQLLEVNEEEQRRRRCGMLVTQRQGRWQLTAHGERWLSLLTY
jgi:murein DD-endopeptidase MepM/ murein hydrolase activator NlpD